MRVKVAVAWPDCQRVYPVELEPGAKVEQAIEACGVLGEFPNLVIDPTQLGIFSRPAGPDTPLREGDRVEIYRPLPTSPGEARRRRAANS